MYATTIFVRIIDDRTITRQINPEFFFEFQRGVLLSLKEIGTLNEMQYKHAEEALKKQHRATIRAFAEQGGKP